MSKNSLAGLLAGALVLLSLFAFWACLRYYFSLQQWRQMQVQALAINNVRGATFALANEAVEYGKKNPAINPILEKFDVIGKGTNAPAALTPPTALK